MQYICLIYADEKNQQNMSDAERGAYFQAYGQYTQELKGADAMVAGDALHPVSMATTVRVRDGKTLTTDGPFAETHEQLGGFYIVEAENLDEAIAWAAKIPTSAHGSIEVRPIMVFDQ